MLFIVALVLHPLRDESEGVHVFIKTEHVFLQSLERVPVVRLGQQVGRPCDSVNDPGFPSLVGIELPACVCYVSPCQVHLNGTVHFVTFHFLSLNTSSFLGVY